MTPICGQLVRGGRRCHAYPRHGGVCGVSYVSGIYGEGTGHVRQPDGRCSCEADLPADDPPRPTPALPSPAPHNRCRGCGTPWPDPAAPWPRTCLAGCGKTTWQNLTPVAVLVVPLEDVPGHYLGVRRAIQPALGATVCPSGFMEAPNFDPSRFPDTLHWADEAARELIEETGVFANSGQLSVFHVASAPGNPANLLLFVEAPPVSFEAARRAFVPNAEVSELVPLSSDSDVPWSTHRDALRRRATDQDLDALARAAATP